jgi:hypothetical protein
MQFKLEDSLRDYIAAGNETTNQVLQSGSSFVSALEEFDDFFTKHLWAADDIEMSPTQAFLSMHAFMIHLSAVRMALSGHAAATFPLFRTAVESACYAYVISEDDALERIWSDRHKSDEALRKCRKHFTPAVSEAARSIEATQPEKGFAAWLNECYQSAIDFGAHPNPRSIYHHVQIPDRTGDLQPVNLIGLYGANSFETKRSLMACLDYALILAAVLAHGLKSPPEDISEKLSQLNELKERLTKEHFPDAYEAMGPQ